MATIFDVPVNDLLEKAAEELKKTGLFKPPVWATLVKTGMHKERPPTNKDWWYMRLAAVLRSVYVLGPIGVSKLRTKYGGLKNRGHKPEKFYKGSGSIIRKALQQLERAEYIKFGEKKGAHKGRLITPKGKSFLDKAASSIYKKSTKKVIEKKETPKIEKPEPKNAEKEKINIKVKEAK